MSTLRVGHTTSVVLHDSDVPQNEIDLCMRIRFTSQPDRLRCETFQLIHSGSYGHIVFAREKIDGVVFAVDDKHHERNFIFDVSCDNSRQDTLRYAGNLS